jgi:hypothetical protein
MTDSFRLLPPLLLLAIGCSDAQIPSSVKAPMADIYVDPEVGNDRQEGTAARPLRTLSAALALVPQEVHNTVTLHLKPGVYSSTGGQGMLDSQLVLSRSMVPGVIVRLKGEAVSSWPAKAAILDWRSESKFLVTVLNGNWSVSNVQLGTRQKTQRQGFCCEGSGSLLELRDVRIRTASLSGAGIQAQRAGRVHLYGKIELNEDLHQACPDMETYCRVQATDHGTVQFVDQNEGSLLSIGHGSLSSEYYGVIRLGCRRSKITTWGKGENNLGIGNSGRIDLHGTETHLRGGTGTSGLIGPEDDGHLLAEDTHVILESLGCRNAIYLQKASTLFGGPFEVRGPFTNTVVAMSGSVFVGIITGAVTHVEAHTGAHITLEHGSSKPRTARGYLGGTVVLPNDEILR